MHVQFDDGASSRCLFVVTQGTRMHARSIRRCLFVVTRRDPYTRRSKHHDPNQRTSRPKTLGSGVVHVTIRSIVGSVSSSPRSSSSSRSRPSTAISNDATPRSEDESVSGRRERSARDSGEPCLCEGRGEARRSNPRATRSIDRIDLLARHASNRGARQWVTRRREGRGEWRFRESGPREVWRRGRSLSLLAREDVSSVVAREFDPTRPDLALPERLEDTVGQRGARARGARGRAVDRLRGGGREDGAVRVCRVRSGWGGPTTRRPTERPPSPERSAGAPLENAGAESRRPTPQRAGRREPCTHTRPAGRRRKERWWEEEGERRRASRRGARRRRSSRPASPAGGGVGGKVGPIRPPVMVPPPDRR